MPLQRLFVKLWDPCLWSGPHGILPDAFSPFILLFWALSLPCAPATGLDMDSGYFWDPAFQDYNKTEVRTSLPGCSSEPQ